MTPAASTSTTTLARARRRVGALLHPQQRRRTELVADDGTHGHARYRRLVDPIRPVRPDELALLPALELAADTMFESLGIGPLPGPGTVEEFAAALVVLVAGDLPVGLCRIDGVGDDAHLEQLSVHPDHARRGTGRALLRGRLRLGGGARLPRAHARHLPRHPLERALLRLGGLRRGRAGGRLARPPRARTRGARHDPLRDPGPHAPDPVSSP